MGLIGNISGTPALKTINGNSLLGSGNLVVGGGEFSGTMDDITNGVTYVKTENNLTDALVSTIGSALQSETSHADVLVDGDIGVTVAAALGVNDNYVTDAEKIVIGNTSGANSGDNATNTQYSGLVTNANHSGDATGATALTVVAIRGKSFPTLGAGDDEKYPKYDNDTGAFIMTAIAGGGDTIAPAANTADYIPQWNGANSKTLKDGLAVPTGGLAGLTAPQLSSIELGHASDTTITRVSAGLVSIEGKTILTNTVTSGVAATPTASSTQQITHSLGRVPTIIRIFGQGAKVASTSASNDITSFGVYSSSGNTCIYRTGGASAGQGSSSTYAINITTSAGNGITGIIGNITATTFDIVWTEAGTSVAGVLLWEAQ